MRKRTFFISLALAAFAHAGAQMVTVKNLEKELGLHARADTVRINLLNQLAKRSEIAPSFRDSLLNESVELSRKIAYTEGEAMALSTTAQYADISRATNIARQAVALAEKSGSSKAIFWAYRSLGQAMLNTSENIKAIEPFRKALATANASGDPNLIVYGQLAFVDYYKNAGISYPVALEWSLKALQTAEQHRDTGDLPVIYRNVGLVYLMIGENEKSLVNFEKALATSRQTGDIQTLQFTLNDVGERYRITGKYTEALKAYGEAALLIKDPFNIELNESNVADVYQRMGNNALSFVHAFRALAGARQLKDTIGMAWIANILSRAYLNTGNVDSALYYGVRGYQYAVGTQTLEFKRDNSEALANAYAAGKNFERSLYYYKIYIRSRDSMLSNEIASKTNLAQYNYDLEKKQTEITVLNKDKQLQQVLVQRQRIFLIAAIAVLLFIMISLMILYRNNRKRKIAYGLLHGQKREIEAQRDQINQALKELKATQNQLIQSEKMASLGELTAGIAHEIQNPLNFVNNFSEVSNELVDEMKIELDKGDIDEAKAIANDIRQNLEKIAHHGKRADAIVKGMLQHSRSGSGQKEPTDINALCDEYLRLSYHGLRAKDKSFNAAVKTDFDESAGDVKILSQDLGRVILNLLTNAFYAVNEKKQKQPAGYEPSVSISTKRLQGKVEIRVSDNGSGIPPQFLDKIFQPFFTTKPTGQGTGLGLSMSYDIVTNGHGGELKVETREGGGTAFLIILPA